MLRALAIRDVVLIERLDIDFKKGLSALTGETGAGKSILLDSLALALGARSDAGLIRQQCPSWERVATGADAEVVVDAAAEFVRAVFRYRA